MSLPPIVEVPQELIVVTRDTRQRTDLDPDGVAKLAADIRRHGLLNAIIVEDTNDKDRALVRVIAGERRLAACRSLGWSHIPCRFWSELSSLDRQRLEWAENAHRTDLPWPDRARAIAAYHEAALAEGTKWRVADTARDLGLASAGYVCLNILVAQAAKARPELWTLTSVRQAYNAIERQNGRELGNVLAEVLEGLEETSGFEEEDELIELGDEEDEDFEGSSLYKDGDVVVTTGGAAAVVEVPRSRPVLAKPPTPAPARFSIHNTDFASWAAAYTGPPFTVLHLDPPYGIGFTNTGIFRKANALDGFYSDEASDLDAFWQTLKQNWHMLVAPAAHIVYWFSMDRYSENRAMWESMNSGGDYLWVNPTPLIWHKSNNRGMMTTPDKRPRHTYEAAFLITVGGQKLARPMGTDVVSEPAAPSLHPSAKPLAVVRTWLSGVVDASSRVLDPTCGHGSAIQAALELGAREAVGVELDPTHAARAKVEIATQARELQALETVSL